MAATIAIENTLSLGGTEYLYTGTIALDASYPTGGEAIDVTANEKFNYVLAVSKGGYVFSWDRDNQKLLAYYGDNNNAADGPLIEVPNATDLSAVTGIQFIAIGQ